MVKNLETSRLESDHYQEQVNLPEVVFFTYKMGAVSSNIKSTGKEAKQPLLLSFLPQHMENSKGTRASNLGGNNNTKATNHLLMTLANPPTQPSFSQGPS